MLRIVVYGQPVADTIYQHETCLSALTLALFYAVLMKKQMGNTHERKIADCAERLADALRFQTQDGISTNRQCMTLT